MEVGLLVDALHTQLGLHPAAADHLLLLLGGDPGLAIDQDTFVTSALGWWTGREEGLVEEGGEEVEAGGGEARELSHRLSMEVALRQAAMEEQAEAEERLRCAAEAEDRWRRRSDRAVEEQRREAERCRELEQRRGEVEGRCEELTRQLMEEREARAREVARVREDVEARERRLMVDPQEVEEVLASSYSGDCTRTPPPFTCTSFKPAPCNSKSRGLLSSLGAELEQLQLAMAADTDEPDMMMKNIQKENQQKCQIRKEKIEVKDQYEEENTEDKDEGIGEKRVKDEEKDAKGKIKKEDGKDEENVVEKEEAIDKEEVKEAKEIEVFGAGENDGGIVDELDDLEGALGQEECGEVSLLQELEQVGGSLGWSQEFKEKCGEESEEGGRVVSEEGVGGDDTLQAEPLERRRWGFASFLKTLVKVLVVTVLLYTMFGAMVVEDVELLPGTWVALRRAVGPALPRPATLLVYTSNPRRHVD